MSFIAVYIRIRASSGTKAECYPIPIPCCAVQLSHMSHLFTIHGQHRFDMTKNGSTSTKSSAPLAPKNRTKWYPMFTDKLVREIGRHAHADPARLDLCNVRNASQWYRCIQTNRRRQKKNVTNYIDLSYTDVCVLCCAVLRPVCEWAAAARCRRGGINCWTEN